MALIAKLGHLGRQFEALFTLYRMLLFFLLVTRETIIFFYRGVWFHQANNSPVAGINRA
jgi:hypothetical protein